MKVSNELENWHTNTRSNKQSTAKGLYQSTLIKQNAHRETLTKQESRKILTKRKKMGLEMNTARTSSRNAANEKTETTKIHSSSCFVCACCSCYSKCRCSEEDVYSALGGGNKTEFCFRPN